MINMITTLDRLWLKLEAWRDTPEVWLALLCATTLLAVAYCAER